MLKVETWASGRLNSMHSFFCLGCLPEIYFVLEGRNYFRSFIKQKFVVFFFQNTNVNLFVQT